MNSPKSCLAISLVLVAAGSSVLAWRQYKELVELRAASIGYDDEAALQHRMRDDGELGGEARVEPLDDGPETEVVAAAGEARGGRGPGPGPGSGRGGPRGPDAMREVMNSPQAQALRMIQQKSALDARYAGLFKNLNLAPGQLEKFKTLLTERQATTMDVTAAAREQGIDSRSSPEEFRKLMTAAQSDIDSSIKAAIGEAGYAQYQSYEQTAAQRSVVSQLEQRLSYSATPLSPTQAEELVKILAATTPATVTSSGLGDGGGARIGAGGPGGGFGGRGGDFGGGPPPGGGNVAPIATAAIVQAQAVLSTPQMSALQELQQQQQAQQQLQQLMNDARIAQEQNGGALRGGRRGGG